MAGRGRTAVVTRVIRTDPRETFHGIVKVARRSVKGSCRRFDSFRDGVLTRFQGCGYVP